MSRSSPYPDRSEQLRAMAATFADSAVTSLTEYVLAIPGFTTCSGSIGAGKHHEGTGGLLQHTWEVATLAMAAWPQVTTLLGQEVDRRQLFLACLWHDVGKRWDYEQRHYIDMPSFWEATPHKRLINHLNRSAVEWCRIAPTYVDKETEDAVLHAILSHHAEFGSSVLPKTRVAWMLHLADQLSARMNDADTLDLGAPKTS